MENRFLFRGKRIDNGEWAQGSLVQTVAGSYIVAPYKHETILGEGSVIEIDPSTICQCTGLRDKNGKLIWENDIVKNFNGIGDECSISKIVFDEHSLNLGWCKEDIKSLIKCDKRLYNTGFNSYKASNCEAVGNIFDDPELLKGAENGTE